MRASLSATPAEKTSPGASASWFALADRIPPKISDGLTFRFRFRRGTGIQWLAFLRHFADGRLPIDPQSLEFGHRVLGTLAVVIGHIQCEFFQRDTVVPTLLANVGEVGHLGQASDQFISRD
jgi:hypothetical protein